MSEYIKRDEAIKAVEKRKVKIVCNYESNKWFNKMISEIEAIPTIEPKHGEWRIEKYKNVWGDGYMLTCSVCGDTVTVTEAALPYEHFCRNCGADMRGDGNE